MVDKVIKTSKIIALLEEGCSQCFVAQRLNVSRSTVQRTWQRYQETGSVKRRPGSGRKTCTEPRDDRFLVSQALRNRKSSYVDLKNTLEEVRNVQISLWTTHEDWDRVLFSDEARISLHGEDRRRRVLRRRGERFVEACFEEITPYGGGSVMFWAGINSMDRTELVFIENGTLTRHRYITEVLISYAQPALTALGENSIFMDDNARAHRSGGVDAYMLEVGIRRLDWPARSPDLNPIEHVWDVLKRRVRSVQPAPQTIRELKNVFTAEWERIPQETIKDILTSMPRRMQAVISARGGHTQY
ncbi:unnamed protein product [Euphydryas editha]|uniref:Tc1-like transposase DDE domain-containing protein n=1 Tax=Euphydryas editha TaxID=104508 RepID=A0AAU9VAX1_EUPED|nr:unnamed protein product [Euphydryas editha]